MRCFLDYVMDHSLGILRMKRMMIIAKDSHLVRRRRWLFAIALLFLTCMGRANAQGCSGVSNSTTGTVTWTPQWCQEFTGAQASPDTTAWNFDLGNNNGWGNHEVEVYCGPPGYKNNPAQCPTTFSTASNTVYVDGSGHLVIQPIDSNGTWISTRMNTEGTKSFQYGRIEASLQLPDTTDQGLWPAFWSLGSSIASGTPWPTCGEADFMENWSPQIFNGPGPNGNKSTIHTAVTGGSGVGGSYIFPSGELADTAFHAYGVIWSPNMMQFYIDDATQPFLIKTPSDLPSGDTWPFNAQIFLLMNVAVGGTLGGSTANLVNPQPLMADYVRVYSPSVVAQPTLGTPPSISVKAGATTNNSSTFTPGLTPGTGFAYFACSTDAPNASCAISTTDPLNTYVVNSSAAESVTVTVTTTANSVLPPAIFSPKFRPWLPMAIAGFLALTLAVFARRMRSRAWRYSCTLVAVLVLGGVMIAGCGGGNGTMITPPSNGTSPGSYTVTVYAFIESNTSNGSNSNADASVSIPLTVN
jgi:beta-glucanase (GH16 family)